jgi:preprotein translocase subunit SecG
VVEPGPRILRNNMYYVLFLLHLFIAFLLCVVVLLQRSKGSGLAGAFGGVGAGEAMFGARGVTTMLHKATIWLAVAFMISSMGLAVYTARRGSGGDTRVDQILLDTLPASAVPGAVDPVASPVGSDDVVPQSAPADAATEEGGGDGR